MRHAAHVANPARRVAAAQADEPREEARQRAGAREPVVVDAEPQIAIRAAGIRGEQAAIEVAHGFGVFGGAERMAVFLPLARAIPQRRGAPEFGAGRLRAPQREVEQGIDARQLECRGIARRRPPDVRACLKHHGRGIGRVACGEVREKGRRALEVPPVQRIEPRAQRHARIRGTALQQENERVQHLQVSAARR